MTEAEREREAVVAWLRRADKVFSGLPCPFKSFSDLADAIERGNHLQGKE